MTNILIVDDSGTMRKIIMRVLRQAGLDIETITEAGNGKEGLEQLAASPNVDCILSDINMPEMNGIDFVKAIRAQPDLAKIPVIMISTEGGDAMVQSAMESGANGYVTKPFTPDSIREGIEKVMSK